MTVPGFFKTFRSCLSRALPGARRAGILLLSMLAEPIVAAEPESIDFTFLRDPPGRIVSLDSHRLQVDCRGKGEVTILFEAGLGGSSLEWQWIQRRLAKWTSSCVYDRAGYGWSDPSPYPRHARQLALEARSMLSAMRIDGPLLLVGHSFGGFIIRELASLPDITVVGMVLIDSSHEDQFNRFEAVGGKALGPTGSNFIISAFDVPENLPQDIRRKVKAISRLPKNNAATRAELAMFRLSAKQVESSRSTENFPLVVPLVVLSRGLDLYSDNTGGKNKNEIWQELQADLVNLSVDGKLIRALNSGHHIHADEPDLVARTIEDMLDAVEKN